MPPFAGRNPEGLPVERGTEPALTIVGGQGGARTQSPWATAHCAASRHEKEAKPKTEEQRGKRACALTARESTSTAMKGLVGGAAAGTAEHRKLWTMAQIPRSGHRHASHRSGASPGGARSVEERCKRGTKRNERTGPVARQGYRRFLTSNWRP